MKRLRAAPTAQISLRAAHDDGSSSAGGSAPGSRVGAQLSLCAAPSATTTSPVCNCRSLCSSSQCCLVPVPRHSPSLKHAACAVCCSKRLLQGWVACAHHPPGRACRYISLLLPEPLSSQRTPLTKRSPSSSSATISSSTSFKPFKPPKGVPAPLLLPLATSETTPWLGALDMRDLRRESCGRSREGHSASVRRLNGWTWC